MSDGISKVRMASTAAALLAVAWLAACSPQFEPTPASNARAAADAGAPMRMQMMPVDALRVVSDPLRNRRWILHPHGVGEVRPDGSTRSVALPGWIRVGDADACAPDLTVTPDGDALVTSNVVPVIWRIDGERLDVSRHELSLDDRPARELGFSGIAYSVRHGRFFAIGSLDGSLWSIDRSLTHARRIRVSPPLAPGCGIAVRAPAQARGIESLCVRTVIDEWTVSVAEDRGTAIAQLGRCAQG
ncbi:MAG TPA: hypothetical protein VM491_16740 [Burkholderiaceae bacterium]|nr:hypothetical protein [Burkholderiaceae bacterium]